MSFREIVEDDGFEHDRARIEPDAKRLDDAMRGIYWALAKDPAHFPLDPTTRRLRMVATDPFPDMPPVRIWYTFGQTQVILLGMELCDDEDAAPDPFDE